MYERKYKTQVNKSKSSISNKFLTMKNIHKIQQRASFLFSKNNLNSIKTKNISSLDLFSKPKDNIKRVNSYSFINKTPTSTLRINSFNQIATKKIPINKKTNKICYPDKKSRIDFIICDLKDEIKKTREINKFKLQIQKNNSYSNLNNKKNNFYKMDGYNYINTLENKIRKNYSSIHRANKNNIKANKTTNNLFNHIKNLSIDNNNNIGNFYQFNKPNFGSLSNKPRFNYIYNFNEKCTTLNNFNKQQSSPTSIFNNYRFSKGNNQINDKTEYLRDIMINMEKQKKPLTKLYYNNDMKSKIRSKNFYSINHLKDENRKTINFSDINNKLSMLNSKLNFENNDDSIDIKSIDNSSILGESLKKRNLNII